MQKVDEEAGAVPPLIRHLFRSECPACGRKWLSSRWDNFRYPLHYISAHLGICPWRRLSPVIWTHAICGSCWEIRCITAGWPGRRPHVLTEPQQERCCFCGRDTREGIYVRNDPRELGCSHAEEE